MSEAPKKEGRPTDSDYYAWSAKMKETSEELEKLGVSDFAPKKLEQQPQPDIARSTSGSAWNHAGTWEDKDVSSWAPKELENALAEFVTPVKVNGSDASFVVKEVEKCDGSVTIIISRGKIRLGYELDVKLKWSVVQEEGKGEEVASGSIHMPDVADDAGGDYDYEVKVSKGGSDGRSAASEAKKEIFKVIGGWVEKVKTKR